MIHDNADHHLVEVRPVVLAMTTLAEHVAGEVHIATKRGQAGVLLQRLIELVENDHIHTAWAHYRPSPPSGFGALRTTRGNHYHPFSGAGGI
jgi:hypothetical protein